MDDAEPEAVLDADVTDEGREELATPRPKLQRPNVRYSDAELAQFRKHILAERQHSLEEFEILKDNLEEITNSEMADENASYSMHMAEQGTNAQEKEKIYAHVQRLGDYIKKLDDALQRIDDKVYGICRMCGILIAKERLMAVPITTQSASYKIFKKCPEDGIDRIVRR
jgi:RNA polymerase-binding transcription factor DksA